MLMLSNGLTFGANSAFRENLAGGGTVTYNTSGTVATLTSAGAAGDRAFVELSGIAGTGELIRIDAEARATAGEISMGLSVLTGPGSGTGLSEVTITKQDWRNYTIWHAANDIDIGEAYNLYFGAKLGVAGAGQFRNIRVSVDNTAIGAPRILAQGTIRIIGGAGTGQFALDLQNNFRRHGVKSLDRISSTRFTITPSFPLARVLGPTMDDGYCARPQFHGQTTIDNRRILIPIAGNWLDADDEPKREAIDVGLVKATGATDANAETNLLDLDAFNGTLYIQFMLVW